MKVLNKKKITSDRSLYIYGRNQLGCEKAEKVGCLPSIHFFFFTIYIFVDLMKITMCFNQLEASHIISCDS